MSYYGSTIQPLCKRMSEHRSKYKRYNNGNIIRMENIFIIFNEVGVENCKIELVEIYPCENKNQLHQKEGEYIKNNECVNKNIAGRTSKEYHKEYYNLNKEQIQAYHKKYYSGKLICNIYKKDMYRSNKSLHLKTKLHQKALTDQCLEPEEEAPPAST